MSSRKIANRIAVTLAVFSWAASSSAETLTLDEAVSLAIGNNRGLRISALETQKAQDRLEATRSRQFPGISLYMLGAQQLRSFDFTLEKGILGNYEKTGPLPDQDVHLTTPVEPTGLLMGRVSQPLTNLIRIRRNMATQKTAVTLADEQTRSERQKLAREIKRVYYGLQQVESSLRSVRATAELYDEVEQLTSRYVIQEVALRGDLLESRTRVAKTRQLEVSLRNQQASAKEQLNQLLGRDVLTEFEVQPMLEISGDEPALEEARARALANRPEIRQAQLRWVQAQQDLRAKKAEYIPEISAEVNSVALLNYGRFLPVQSNSIGVSLSWEPFDWGRKKHESAEKERSVEQARVSKREAESQALVDVNDRHRQLQYKRAELRVARLAQETAIENLRVVKNKYFVRAALVKDVLQGQVGLERSNADYQEALAGFWNARADYERALGVD